ncbi:MAG TPA: VC0807 family protein [Ktedonobacteraceae bacterium]|jgi:hypothetical protein
MENATQANQTPLQKASRGAAILSLAGSIVINLALPIVLYLALKKYTSASDFLALVLSGVPPMVDGIVGVIRRKRIDLLAGIVLASLLISLILIALGSSPKVYLVRESFFTAAFGLAYLVSLFFPRPLAFYFARYFATGNHPENIPWFDSLWQYREFRHTMSVVTLVWGMGFLFEAVVRTLLVIGLSTEQFVIISPFVLYGVIGGLIIWMFLYSRQGRKKGEALRQRMQAEQGTSSL